MSALYRFFGCIACLLLSGAVSTFAQTTGDFNGDGKLDILQLIQCSPTPCANSTIIVRLGKGNGTFRAPINSPTTGFPGGSGTAVADFNGDHKLDIAFLSFASGEEIAVAFGNGDGTFGSTTLYPTPFGSIGLSSGDVNGDHLPDVVLSGATISVLINDGSGAFRALPDAAGAFAECALVDANHDGKLDLIGSSIQLGNGDGTFQAPQTISGPGNCPVVGDFNGDGNVDVISSTTTGVDLYLGNGNGTFKSPIHRWLFPGQATLTIADFNGDGKPDLFAALASQADVLLNKGNGTFQPAVGYLCPCGILGDFNADGRTDVVAFGSQPWSAVLASADGTLPLPRSFLLPGGRTSGYLATTDWNGDGKIDLAVINHQSDGWDSGEIAGLLGKGDGTFTPQKAVVPTGTGSIVIGMADLNNDGKLDVVVGGRSLNVLLGLGNGLFQPPQSYPVRNARGTIADVNGDGIPDLVLVFGSFFRPQGIVMLGNGDGSFRNGSTLPGSFDQVVAGDFNHDGKQDLAGTASGAGGVEGQVGILLSNGDGTFQPISSVRKGQVGRLMAGDFNNDGILDVAGVGTTASFAATASVYLGAGTGALQPPKNVWVKGGASYPGGALIADLNKDGKLDLAVSLSLNRTVILFGNGTGGFGSRTEYLGGGGPLVAGDFDQDGVQDLAVMTDGHTVAILLRGK